MLVLTIAALRPIPVGQTEIVIAVGMAESAIAQNSMEETLPQIKISFLEIRFEKKLGPKNSGIFSCRNSEFYSVLQRVGFDER